MRLLKLLSMYLLISLLSINNLEAQLLKKLKKRVQEATEDVIAEKAAQKAEQETGKALDSLLEIDPDYQANYEEQLNQMMISGSEDIPIEERDPAEVTVISGARLTPQGVAAYNPAFDVTPADLVTGIITEKGLIRPPYPENLAALAG